MLKNSITLDVHFVVPLSFWHLSTISGTLCTPEVRSTMGGWRIPCVGGISVLWGPWVTCLVVLPFEIASNYNYGECESKLSPREPHNFIACICESGDRVLCFHLSQTFVLQCCTIACSKSQLVYDLSAALFQEAQPTFIPRQGSPNTLIWFTTSVSHPQSFSKSKHLELIRFMGKGSILYCRL